MDDHLLPSNATAFERAASRAINVIPRLASGVNAIRTAKLVSIPDSFIPFLIYEYGLGPVSAYVENQRFLLSSGIDWQRLRGTPDAVRRALEWVGYAATIEEAPTTRRRWHLFQLGLDRLRQNEQPDLERIEGVTNLSVAVRSQFNRGFFGYDVREMDYSRRRWSGSRYSGSSGARIRSDGAKWSFGRASDFDVQLRRGELIALGAWQEPLEGGNEGWGLPVADIYPASQTGWGNFSWDSTPATWEGTEAGREVLIAAALADRPLWVVFRRTNGSVIGYRRARVARVVEPNANGPYIVNGRKFAPFDAGRAFYVEAMTDFGNGNGETATRVSLLFDAVPLDATRPGLQWAVPGQLSGGVDVAMQVVNIPLGRTVRDRVRFHLTF